MAYQRKDPRSRQVVTVAKASGALVSGQLVKKNGTSNNVTAFTADGVVFGICVKAAASADAYVDIDIIQPGTWLVADVGTGTPASGDLKSCDAQAASPSLLVDVSGTTNNDFLYMYNGTTTTVDVLPKKIESITDNA